MNTIKKNTKSKCWCIKEMPPNLACPVHFPELGIVDTVRTLQSWAKNTWPNSAGITQFNEGHEPGLGFLVFGEWGGVCQDCGKHFKGKKQIERIRFGHEGCPVGHVIWPFKLQELIVSTNPENYLKQNEK